MTQTLNYSLCEPEFPDSHMQMQALEACGGDSFCLFDMAATGRMEVRISTFAASQELEKLLKFLDQVDEHSIFTLILADITKRKHL